MHFVFESISLLVTNLSNYLVFEQVIDSWINRFRTIFIDIFLEKFVANGNVLWYFFFFKDSSIFNY